MRLLLILRAEVFLGVGLFITFNQAHTYATGVTALALFAFGYALVSGIASLVKRGQIALAEGVVPAVIALAVGIGATVTASDAQLWLVKLLAFWGIAVGITEFAQAYRVGLKSSHGKDLVISSALALAFGIFYLAVPLAELDVVGYFGAYLILSAVHLGIAAASERKAAAGN